MRDIGFINGPTEVFHGLNESVFGSAAPRMVELGWSVFPQETSGERRKPGTARGEMIRWQADHDLEHCLPTPQALTEWCAYCGTLNVACVMGPATGNMFALDIDILDDAMSAEVQAMAVEALGATGFRRVGRAPKAALFYRAPEGTTVRSTSKVLATGEGHGVEVLGAGRPITIHGRHHKTGL